MQTVAVWVEERMVSNVFYCFCKFILMFKFETTQHVTRHHNPNAKQTDQGGTLSLMLDDVARYAAWTMSLPEVISSPSAAVCDLWKVVCVVNVIARFSHTITHVRRIEPGLCDCGACGTGNLEGITVSERAVEDLFYWFEWLSCLTFALIMIREKLKLIFAVFSATFCGL